MKPINRYFVIAEVENRLYRYEVDEKLYTQIKAGDKIKIAKDKYGMPEVKLHEGI